MAEVHGPGNSETLGGIADQHNLTKPEVIYDVPTNKEFADNHPDWHKLTVGARISIPPFENFENYKKHKEGQPGRFVKCIVESYAGGADLRNEKKNPEDESSINRMVQAAIKDIATKSKTEKPVIEEIR